MEQGLESRAVTEITQDYWGGFTLKFGGESLVSSLIAQHLLFVQASTYLASCLEFGVSVCLRCELAVIIIILFQIISVTEQSPPSTTTSQLQN